MFMERFTLSIQLLRMEIDMATFTNKATLSYNGKTTDSNVVTGTFTETLSVTKTALVDTYTQGSSVIYIVSLVNAGTTALNGLTVTDDLGQYDFGGTSLYPLTYVDGSLAYYVNGVLQADPAAAGGPPLSVTGIGVPAGGNAILIYEAEANEYAPLDTESTITNTVTVSGALGEDVTAQEVIGTLDEPDLVISKALCPTTVTENGELTYTFVIQNSGNTPAVATDNATLTDTFDPILTISSVILNGAPLAEGSGYTYNEATGEFATVAGIITVPAATYTQNPDGTYTVTPGSTTLTVTGTI